MNDWQVDSDQVTGIVVKLDKEKAYDHVNGDFLLYISGVRGLGIAV